MFKWLLMIILSLGLVGCSGEGDNTNTTTNNTNNTNSNNVLYDTNKTYYVITRDNLAQLAEVGTLAIPNAGTHPLTALEFAANGIWLAVGHNAGASVFDLSRLNEAPRLLSHSAKVNDVAWDGFGSILATASDDGTVKLWDMTTGEAKLTFTSPNGGKLRHVAISNNGNFFAVAQDFSNVYIVSMTSGEVLATFALMGNPSIQDMAITADSASLVVAADVVRVFDIITGEEKRQIPVQLGVSSFDLASDDKRLFISTLGSGSLLVVDITTGEQRFNQPTEQIYSQAVLSADQQLLVGFWNFQGAKMAFYDTYDMQPVGTPIALPTGSIDKIAYGSDGTMIATVGIRNGSPTLSIWRVNS